MRGISCRAGDLTKHVEAKNPGYTFLKKYTRSPTISLRRQEAGSLLGEL
jgi:hypothetical protein